MDISEISQIGGNHKAFGVGKPALLEWINDFYVMDYKKIEETKDGALYLQILDSMYPEMDIMNDKRYRPQWDFKTPYDMQKNWKKVQKIMVGKNVTKVYDISNLIEGKPVATLAFLQWFKFYFVNTYNGQPYDAVQRRGEKNKNSKAKTYESKAPKTKSRAKTKKYKKKGASKKSGAVGEDVAAEIERLEQVVEELTKERDFYFGKLREIEVMCQPETGGATVEKKKVLSVLYQTDADNEFQQPKSDKKDSEDDTF